MTSTDATLKLSLAEFLELPETKPASEYINGRIYQKPMPQGNIVSYRPVWSVLLIKLVNLSN
jgi:Uma2 family endonuclease